jgi:transposase
MQTLCVGVDVAKATLAVAVWQEGAGRSLGEFPNTPTGFARLALVLGQAQPAAGAETIHLALEPTAGYELALAGFALEQGWRVSMPNPKQLRDWAKGLGQRAKTDAQDALLLAHFAAERQPPPWQPLPPEGSELESLLERQRDLEHLLQQERNRKEALSVRPGVAPSVGPNVQRVIEALEAALQEVKAALQEHLKQHPALAEQARRLRQVPGVGDKSVLPLLVLLARWATLTGGTGPAKGLAAYVGLDPETHRSGTSVRGREPISRQGDRQLRAQLYMCALGGVKGNNALRAFYQRLVGRGKTKKVALVAAARKVLVWSWAVYRDHVDFQPERAGAPIAEAA